MSQLKESQPKDSQRNNRILNDEEKEWAYIAARGRGLTAGPDGGWTVSWDNQKRCNLWTSPDGSRVEDSIEKALVSSAELGMLDYSNLPLGMKRKTGKRILSQEEIDEAMKSAKERGLPDGWTISYNNKFNQRHWTSPCGKHKCDGVKKALEVSVKLGLLPLSKLPPNNCFTRTSRTCCNDVFITL